VKRRLWRRVKFFLNLGLSKSHIPQFYVVYHAVEIISP